MERNYKLYVHIAPNGKKYYGITMQKPERRWANGKGYQNNEYFTRAINKYGWSNIQHIVLQESLDEEEAKELEQYMIQWYDTANPNYGYNQTLGGEGTRGFVQSEETKKKKADAIRGRHHTEEAKRKIGEAHKGRKLSAEHIQKIREGNKNRTYTEEHMRILRESRIGTHHTEEAKRKIGEASKGRPSANKGKKFSEEYRQKLSEAHKGKYTGKDNPASKSVICITTNSVFYSGMEAGRYYNISNKGISRCCKGKGKSAGKSPTGEKLVWRYIDIIEL